PSSLMLGSSLKKFPGSPVELRDTHVVVPATRSRRSTSLGGNRIVACGRGHEGGNSSHSNATKRPSALTAAWTENAGGNGKGLPALPRLTQRVVPARVSRTKRWNSVGPGAQGGARFVDWELNTRNRPSALSAGPPLKPLPGTPLPLTVPQVVLPVTRSRSTIWGGPNT